MKIVKYFFASFSLLFIFSKCEKDPTPDPNSFYFQCKLNGKLYLPNSCANCTQGDLIGDTVLILGGNNGFETLGVGVRDLSGIIAKTYPLNEEMQHRGDYKNSTITYDRYFTDANHTGSLSITTLDKVNKIISGTFYFKAYNAYRNDSVNITNGQFRLKYKS